MTKLRTIAPFSEPMDRKTPWLFGVLAILLAIAVAGRLTLGSVEIPFSQVVTILLGNEPTQTPWRDIILQFRLPRAIAAILAGAALSVSGLQVQTLFRNPLAGPSILGINAGASLAVALVVLVTGSSKLPNLGIAMAAGIGAGLAASLLLLISQQLQSQLALLVFGLMFGYMTTAFVTIFLHFSSIEQTQSYLVWTFGSFAGVTWSQIRVLLPLVLLGLILSSLLCGSLNLLLLGDEQARNLGLSVRAIRIGIILSSSLLAGTVTAFCGPVAFLGVAVPHLCRSLFKSVEHRLLIPATILLGALLALFADAIAQFPGQDTVLPLNAVTALLGAPVVTWLVWKRQHFFY
ncbi:iron ABC transporter permease [Spirulina sp. CS-785/01]|uniref:iron ABC transporter permease n=1 Tax=Spirulina sp. CS-785/01 TaxID=3021716 RepID=UPI002330DE99|nr:iron ABC transporter permease [Spirulina sp. CS-785/01]MDB9312298.1 iron ABC transporter permease [Spirulina sp. CS-785/01]